MSKDWNKVMIGGVVGLGALALFHFGRPVKDRAGVGDKVLVKDDRTGLNFEVDIRSASSTSITGVISAGPGVWEPVEVTVPRDKIIGFAK